MSGIVFVLVDTCYEFFLNLTQNFNYVLYFGSFMHKSHNSSDGKMPGKGVDYGSFIPDMDRNVSPCLPCP
jgi:hypothetical protein